MKPAARSLALGLAFALSLVAGGLPPAGKADGAQAKAQPEADWKVGLAAVKVTPEMPVVLSGYGGRTKPFDKVVLDIYVKAMALEDSTGQRAVLITTDLLGIAAEIMEPICERIQKKTGLKREQILLNSAHNHAGPQLLLKPLPKDAPGAADALRNIDYTRHLQDKIFGVVVEALGEMQPARLSWGGGIIDFSMNRREFTPGGVILGANPRGIADRGVPVLRIDGTDGKLRAVLFGAAVHNTTLDQTNYHLCGDYAGFAQADVEQRHPGVQAMFMLGCAGDNDPYPRRSMELTRKHGKSLCDEVCRVLETKLRPVRGPLKVAFGYAQAPLQKLTREQLQILAADKRHAQNFGATRMLGMLDKGEKLQTHYPCPVAVWQFGQDMTLVGLSGEVVVDYVLDLERALGPLQLWVAGYCNDLFGYLPSARVLAEGGYETRGIYYGGAGFFDPAAEQVVVQKVRELAGKVGRKLPD